MSKVPLGRVNIAEAALAVYDAAVFQNERKELYFNPRAKAAFDEATNGVASHVAFDILSEDEIAVLVAPKGDDTVPFRESNTKSTAICSFKTIIGLMPELRNVKGKQNRYPYRIDTLADGSRRFVLLIGEGRPTPVTRRNRKAKAQT